jgi:hypothetical protein
MPEKPNGKLQGRVQGRESRMIAKNISGSALMVLACGLFMNLSAQPKLSSSATPEKLCSVDTAASFQVDTVVSPLDANGFRTIFDGTSFKGWWQNCLSSHSSNKTNGAIFRVDPEHHAIYAMSRNGDGGLLSTHKRYAHYELMFMWWPQYGNDGGVFNRYSITGANNVASNQMVLDYLGASGILSYYSEAGFPGSRNGRPWSYNSATSVTIPGSGGGPGSQGSPYINDWTQTTKSKNQITGYGPTDYGCAASGCVASDYLRLWNGNGWMQVREVYYGGLTTNQPATVTGAGDKIHEFTFFRKHYPLNDTNLATKQLLDDTAKWIAVVQDSMVLTSSQVATYQRVNPFAFQVHTGSRYVYESNGGKGSWYADIKVRELDEHGVPTEFTTIAKRPDAKNVTYDLHVVSGALVGSMDVDHLVTVADYQGRVLQQYTGFAGRNISHDLPAHSGPMIVKITTMRGNQILRVKGRAG